MNESMPSLQSHTHDRSASVVQIESSKLMPMLVVLACLSSAAIVLSFMAFVLLGSKQQEVETEVRMLEYYLLELDAKLIAAGIKKPDESVSGKLSKGDGK